MSSDERSLRELLMQQLADMAAETGTVTREQLNAVPVADQIWKVVDQSRGIRNPAELQATLSVMTSPTGPYDDDELEGGLIKYEYRAGSSAGDNTKLRRALELRLPIVLLKKIEPKVFVPLFPVYVVFDNPTERYFLLALDDEGRLLGDPAQATPDQRRYVEQITRRRLHQAEFRGRVMRAYETQCSVCNLRHGRLLDAAHITSDTAEDGLPVVTNGLALCKIHHAAYDADLLGISPDYVVRVNRSLLAEVDGPMLKHGIQEMDRRNLTVPLRVKDRPDRDRLAIRYDRFAAVG